MIIMVGLYHKTGHVMTLHHPPWNFLDSSSTLSVSGSRAKTPRFKSRPQHISNWNTDMPMATLPDAWTYGVTARTRWLVSAVCDKVRQHIWSVISISLWLHIQLSNRTCLCQTLCCWDVRRPTNNAQFANIAWKYNKAGGGGWGGGGLYKDEICKSFSPQRAFQSLSWRCNLYMDWKIWKGGGGGGRVSLRQMTKWK